MKESISLGRRLLDQSLATFHNNLNGVEPKTVKLLLDKLQLTSIKELYQEIGLGNQVALLIARSLLENNLLSFNFKQVQTLSIKGTEGMVVIYGKCCNPIPGDNVVGFSTSGRGFAVHRESCKDIIRMRCFPEKHIVVQWDERVSGTFPVKIFIDTINKQGTLASIAYTVSKSNANIEDVKADCPGSDHGSISLILLVRDRSHLVKIIRNIRAINAVYKVWRC